MWLWFITVVFGITITFLLLSNRFENSLKKKKFKTLRSFPKVSVLIPSYKADKCIARTLERVRSSSYPNKEIIVVNDSDDKTPEIARSFGCRVIQNKNRNGKWNALNIAASKAKGKFLMVLDADTILQKDTMKNLVSSFLEHESAGDNVGMVAPRYTAGNKRNLLAKLCDIEQNFHQSLLKVQMNFNSVLSSRGCCILVSRQAFDSVGGFSPSILEDGDFSAKIIESGRLIKYEPRALVKTKEPETYSELMRAKKRYGKGTFYCAFHHRKTFTLTAQSFVCFYPYFLLALAFIGLLVFQSPWTMTPYMMLLASSSFPAISTSTMLALIGLLSALGIALGASNTLFSSQLRAGLLKTAIPFILVFTPLVTYAYFRGFFSGMADKIHHKPEFNLNDW